MRHAAAAREAVVEGATEAVRGAGWIVATSARTSGHAHPPLKAGDTPKGPRDVRGPVETVRGVLLSVDAVTVTGRPWVRLWLASDGQRTQAWLPRVAPAMILVPAEGVDPARLAEVARTRADGADVVERRIGRHLRTVVRAVARHPGDLVDLRRGFEAMDEVADVLEADVTLEERAVAEHDLRTLGAVAGEGERDWRVEGLVLARVGPADGGALPLRVAALAGEVENHATSPDAAKDRVRRLVLAPKGGDAVVFDAAEGADGDREALARFAERFAALDPDVVLTWGGDVDLWPFLAARADHLGVPLPLARDGGPPEISGAGGNRVASLTGRAHVDLRKTAERDLKFDVKVKTLASVGEHLGVDVDEAAEGAADAEAPAVLAVGAALLPLQEAFARLTRLPLDDASRAGRGRQVEALLFAEATRLGIVAPKRAPAEEGASPDVQYEGGFVLDPKPGLHADVVALDFGAMYPTIMIAYNVSPDTYLVEGEAPNASAHVAPEVGFRFLTEPDGFFRRILRDLVASRRAMKKRMKELPEGPERARLDVEQASVKVLTNAMYGYTGWAQARWGSRACAEATAAWGRHHIKWVMEEARKRGMEVLYGDTDSLFLRAPPDGLPGFVADVNRALPLELEVADRYDVLLFTQAKKKYAGLTKDGRLVARGFEIRRGDWCAAARRVQEEVLLTVLREREPRHGTQAARAAVGALREGRVALDDLVVWKTLTARPGGYKVKPFHAAAVERAEAQRPGFRVAAGAKVGIVIVEGHGPAHDRAVLRDFLAPGQKPDVEWYVDKQLVPAALRVLEPFGVTEDELKGKPKQRSLFEF